MENTFKMLVATLTVLVTHLFGRPDMWLTALITLVIVDYITGLAKAYIQSELSSRIGLKGIVKKILYFAVVAVAVITDNMLGAAGVLRAAVIGFLIANEALSILENCACAGLPVPNILVTALHKLKSDVEEKM